MNLWTSHTALLAVLACASPALANDDLMKLTNDPNNWAIQSGDYAGHRYSKLDQITTDNVGQLKVAWSFSTGVLRGHEGGPLVIGDVMYLHSPFPNIVFALDLNDEQKIIWKYEPKQDPSVIPVMCCDTVNRGVQYADGKIFLHQADTTLVALDAKTGKEIWKVVNGDPKRGETGTGAPLVVKDKVIVGISGAEFGVRGHLTAYDINSGKKVWRAYSMGPDSEILVDPEKTMSLGKPVGKNSSLKTWNADQWKTGGGTTWGYMA
jgi:PQQ-dependent dehydrogenase (methanol/ethanol family)